MARLEQIYSFISCVLLSVDKRDFQSSLVHRTHILTNTRHFLQPDPTTPSSTSLTRRSLIHLLARTYAHTNSVLVYARCFLSILAMPK